MPGCARLAASPLDSVIRGSLMVNPEPSSAAAGTAAASTRAAARPVTYESERMPPSLPPPPFGSRPLCGDQPRHAAQPDRPVLLVPAQDVRQFAPGPLAGGLVDLVQQVAA